MQGCLGRLLVTASALTPSGRFAATSPTEGEARR